LRAKALRARALRARGERAMIGASCNLSTVTALSLVVLKRRLLLHILLLRLLVSVCLCSDLAARV
jgi:hypothetical protein